MIRLKNLLYRTVKSITEATLSQRLSLPGSGVTKPSLARILFSSTGLTRILTLLPRIENRFIAAVQCVFSRVSFPLRADGLIALRRQPGGLSHWQFSMCIIIVGMAARVAGARIVKGSLIRAIYG